MTGTSTGLSWTAASGPVVGYSVQVSRNGSTYREEQRITSRSTRVSGAVGDTLVVRVAAYDAQGRVGPASTASDAITFTAAPAPAPAPSPTPTPPPSPTNAGDVNGDGFGDTLVYSSGARELAVLLLQSDGTRVRQVIGRPSAKNMRPVGYADVDGDGQADVLWRNNQSGANEIWRMNGMTYSVLALPSRPVDWSSAAFRDFDGDGLADLLWHRRTNGESTLWTLNGAGMTSETALDAAPAGMRLAAVADINGDGAPDLTWHDDKTRAVEAWLMDGATPLAAISLPLAPTKGRASGAGDFDGDGMEDLVWKSGTVVRLWFMRGVQAPRQGIAITLSSKRVLSGVSDVDANGRADLVTARGGRFTAFRVAPTGMANAAGEMQWTYQAVALDAVTKSKSLSFLVLQ